MPADWTGTQWQQAYREADIAINPSLVDNMPISVLEALASGVPVVSTNVGGVPFIVNDDKQPCLCRQNRLTQWLKPYSG